MTVTGQHLVDTTSRTHLLLARAGAVNTLQEAGERLAARHVVVAVGRDACHDPFGQAATLTAVTLAVRASLTVSVEVDDPQAIVSAGPWRGTELLEALLELGAIPRLAADRVSTKSRVTIGAPSATTAHADDIDLQVTWDGWVSAVRTAGTRLPERHGCVLAAVAAAALAISEIFLQMTGHLDAGWRALTLSLWDPLATDARTAFGPRLDRLPNQWELIGLGHLGQAAAWCVSLLPYRPGDGETWLVDDDVAKDANVSTGVLTTIDDAVIGPTGTARRKTRLVASALERAGRPTRLVEHRLTTQQRWDEARPSVAIIGVDNLQTRRHLSDVGWPLCVDAGLGSTSSSYNALTVYTLDDRQNSQGIAAWAQSSTQLQTTDIAAFDDLRSKGVDECGIVMLADRAVAAAFVGIIGACLAMSEPLRRLHGAPGFQCVSISLDTVAPVGAPAELVDASRRVLPYVGALSETG